MSELLLRLLRPFAHTCGRFSRRFYFEDFERVYPNGVRFDRSGKRIPATQNDRNNYLNHRKFYAFAGQFAHGATVADIGCGSGYGCTLLRNAGAARVFGTDASGYAIRFAKEQFGEAAEFSLQSITNLREYADNRFDLTVCSEVLEHIKEYGKEERAVRELKRITRPGGVMVIGTPNSELLGDHGFYFDEIDALLSKHFSEYCTFENALVPFGPSRGLWTTRLSEGRTGVIVTEAINLAETVLPEKEMPEVKKGIPAGIYPIGHLRVNTALLHNTHSWAIVAVKQAE